jgi:hypothetical protein
VIYFTTAIQYQMLQIILAQEFTGGVYAAR